MAVVRHKEAIHSGHFMVSNFEAEAQDDEENIKVPVPEEVETAPDVVIQERVQNQFTSLVSLLNSSVVPQSNNTIDCSFSKLFQCMSIAYRQKLTSPKWNRFLGMKLRWKDKIRLNNVIWRCWHMQFIKGHRKLVCAFANPLEIDNHNKTEAGAIMEGKYWKRKMATILAEYKRWRIFSKNQNDAHDGSHSHTNRVFYKTPSNINGVPPHDIADIGYCTTANFHVDEKMKGNDDIGLESMITDADFFVDALFNSLGCQNHNGLDLAGGSEMLQPSLDDLMDLDPMAPLQDWLSSKLPDSTGPGALRGSRGKGIPGGLDIKDIRVTEAASLHPFSHASQQSYYKPNKVLARAGEGWQGDQEVMRVGVLPSSGGQVVVRESVIHGAVELEGRGSVIQSSQSRLSTIVPRQAPPQSSQPPPRPPPSDRRLRASLQGSRQLVELLQPSRPRAHQKPMRSINLPQKSAAAGLQQHLKEETGQPEDLLSSPGGPVGGHGRPLVPPPPPGSLPQPAFALGSPALGREDTKMTSAEQKRRGTIKNGFEFLRALVPSLSQTPNIKISKAALLTKGAEYVLQLKEEKAALNKEVLALRSSVDLLSQEIAVFQGQLPTAGSAHGSMGAAGPSCLQDLFDEHIAACTMQNWKYWVFSRMMQPLLESYDRTVSSTSHEDLGRTAGSWLDQHVSLVQLRPLVLNSLKELSVTTDVLSEPQKMPQEALNAVSTPSPSQTRREAR